MKRTLLIFVFLCCALLTNAKAAATTVEQNAAGSITPDQDQTAALMTISQAQTALPVNIEDANALTVVMHSVNSLIQREVRRLQRMLSFTFTLRNRTELSQCFISTHFFATHRVSGSFHIYGRHQLRC